MKFVLATALLATASAQITPARLRSHNLAVLPEERAEADAADSEFWAVGEEFGRFDKFSAFRMLLADMSMSMSMSMPTSMSMSMSMGVPTPAPFVATPDIPTDVPTYFPTAITEGPTMSKSGKLRKQELFAYSWNLPPEYTGYFEIYEGHARGPKDMHTDLQLIDVVELGTGTAGSNSVFLPREEYTIVVVNQNQAVGFCCDGTQPGWIHFTWGGLEFDKVTGLYGEKKDKDEFVAEFHKNPDKVAIGDDGAYFKFEARL
ncbi:hypothetical protein HJC23_002488 [Cyclotella cryptica]|uniref:Uncharacterized protein n=1 Tax=Cyclotella cryptica TaxID=29204 RepID=A0ABD3PEG0_9STRA|eukprot:CCRYP_015395-RA/>CCRYP_015395-RA protein AED:0.23 eAED:0.23 QI:0/-1/0/1/-1/1/1/0/259